MAQIAPHVGIDVSKHRLEVAVFPDGTRFALDNTPDGWAELARRCAELSVVTIGLEASGGFEQGVARALQEQGFSVRLLNPARVRSFAAARGRLAKNDRIDAEVIARLVATVPGCALPRRSAVRERLSAVLTMRQQFAERLVMVGNQARGLTDPLLCRLSKRHIAGLQADLRLQSTAASLTGKAARDTRNEKDSCSLRPSPSGRGRKGAEWVGIFSLSPAWGLWPRSGQRAGVRGQSELALTPVGMSRRSPDRTRNTYSSKQSDACCVIM